MHSGRWRFLIGFCALLLLSVMAPALLAVPPANDGYSNRFAIVSSPTVVTASLVEATWEDFSPEWLEPIPHDTFSNYYPTNPPSLWWTVILTNPSSLTIEFLKTSGNAQLAIWKHEIVPSWWDGSPRRVGERFAYTYDTLGKFPFATARLTNGGPIDLDVQLSSYGPVSGDTVMRFTVHTNPMIMIAPQSRTASVGESVFFGVLATGHSRLQYQWLHNGHSLAGENSPILSVDQISATNAGNYRVIITDDLGTNSADATLTVSEMDVPPHWRRLERLSTNQWRAQVDLEAGRSYRIETSVNLTNWSPLTNLVQDSPLSFGTVGPVGTSGMVFLTNVISEIRFSAHQPQQFFRANQPEPDNSVCQNNLKKIRFAKELWMIQNLRIGQETPQALELYGESGGNPLYLRNRPMCPSGGVYTLNFMAAQPQCSIHSPLLEPSW
jgi:hypothetical protein